MRYLLRKCTHVVSDDCQPGVGMSKALIGDYASDTNARRYMALHLRKAHFPPGQYLLERWPEGPSEGTPIGHLYKTATL